MSTELNYILIVVLGGNPVKYIRLPKGKSELILRSQSARTLNGLGTAFTSATDSPAGAAGNTRVSFSDNELYNTGIDFRLSPVS